MYLKAIWAHNPPFSKFLLAIGVIIIGASLFTILSAILASMVYGVSLTQLDAIISDFENPQGISILKFIQTFSTFGTFILPALFLAWLFDNQASEYLKISKAPSTVSVILVFGLLFTALPIINYLGELNSRMSL